jgi:hypothetical protein
MDRGISLLLRPRSHTGVKVQIKKSLEMIVYPDINAQSISPICISIMPTSLSKASEMGVYCDNVALVTKLFCNPSKNEQDTSGRTDTKVYAKSDNSVELTISRLDKNLVKNLNVIFSVQILPVDGSLSERF